MSKLSLTLACGEYDRTRALRDGTVRPEGIDLNYIPLPVDEIFWRMIRYEEFDVSEMSMSSYIIGRARRDTRFIAIPVFTSRVFRHGYIFVNADAGIGKPIDLVGKRVGLPEYEVTAAVWIRGLLQNEYGVPLEKIRWFAGGIEQPGRKEKLDITLPSAISLQNIPEGKTLSAMLESGEVDALIAPRKPSCMVRGSSKVRRLFPNTQEIEMDYYRRTGIYHIMHLVVIKEEVYRQNRWVAESLYKAYCEAKEIFEKEMRHQHYLLHVLPWLNAEVERELKFLGADSWPYGLEPNRKTLETFLQYEYEQGLIDHGLEPENLFAASTLEEYKR